MMRRSLTLMFMLGWASVPVAMAPPVQTKASCWDSPVQKVLNECADGEFKRADEELNRLYRELLETHKKDAAFLKEFRTAQRHWLAYRDAHVSSWYPDVHKRFYGSIRPMCQSLILKRLTEERVKLLREMIDPVESDICSFSTEVPCG